MIKLWVAKIRGGGGRSIKERAFCRLFFTKEQREALKERVKETCMLTSSLYANGAARDVPTENHWIKVT